MIFHRLVKRRRPGASLRSGPSGRSALGSPGSPLFTAGSVLPVRSDLPGTRLRFGERFWPSSHLMYSKRIPSYGGRVGGELSCRCVLRRRHCDLWLCPCDRIPWNDDLRRLGVLRLKGLSGNGRGFKWLFGSIRSSSGTSGGDQDEKDQGTAHARRSLRSRPGRAARGARRRAPGRSCRGGHDLLHGMHDADHRHHHDVTGRAPDEGRRRTTARRLSARRPRRVDWRSPVLTSKRWRSSVSWRSGWAPCSSAAAAGPPDCTGLCRTLGEGARGMSSVTIGRDHSIGSGRTRV